MILRVNLLHLDVYSSVLYQNEFKFQESLILMKITARVKFSISSIKIETVKNWNNVNEYEHIIMAMTRRF